MGSQACPSSSSGSLPSSGKLKTGSGESIYIMEISTCHKSGREVGVKHLPAHHWDRHACLIIYVVDVRHFGQFYSIPQNCSPHLCLKKLRVGGGRVYALPSSHLDTQKMGAHTETSQLVLNATAPVSQGEWDRP